MTIITKAFTYKPGGKDKRVGLGAVTDSQILRKINFYRKKEGLPPLGSLAELDHLNPGSHVEAFGRSGERKE